MITLNNIVDRFEEFASAHYFIKSFSHGSPEDVDLGKYTDFPLMHLVYTGASYDDGLKTLNFEVFILTLPITMEDKVDNQTYAISAAEQCAEDIIADIKNGGNIFLFDEQYDLSDASISPLEEETKNVLAGVALSISITIPYQADACIAPIDGITPSGAPTAYARRGTLRVVTLNGEVDVLSVRTIRVNNDTLLDEGDGVVRLASGGGGGIGSVSSVNTIEPDENGNVQLTTDNIPEGENNLYYTNARVSGNDDVSGNKAKIATIETKLDTIEEGAEVNPANTDSLPQGTGNLYMTGAEKAALASVIDDVAGVDRDLGTLTTDFNNLSGSLAPVATTGSYASLTNQPTTDDIQNGVQTKMMTQAEATKLDGLVNPINTDWNITDPNRLDYIKNKPFVPQNSKELSDVPSAYGNAGTVLAVNAAGDGLEYVLQTGQIAEVDTILPLKDVSPANTIVRLDIDEATTSLKGAMSAADKTKLDGIADGAEVNVQSDWLASAGSDAFIQNKPSIPKESTDLLDMPSAYGGAGDMLVVNAARNGYEYKPAEPLFGVAYVNNSVQQIITGTAQVISFTGEYYDEEGIIDPTNNTITLNEGKYLVTADISLLNRGTPSQSRSECEVRMLVNGNPVGGFSRRIYARDATGGTGGSASFSFPYWVPSGTGTRTISWDIRRASGSATALEVYHCQFSYAKLWTY